MERGRKKMCQILVRNPPPRNNWMGHLSIKWLNSYDRLFFFSSCSPFAHLAEIVGKVFRDHEHSHENGDARVEHVGDADGVGLDVFHVLYVLPQMTRHGVCRSIDARDHALVLFFGDLGLDPFHDPVQLWILIYHVKNKLLWFS